MYSRIMVPTDGSGFDREAIRVALRLADRRHAEVRLVRVVSSVTFLGLGEPFEPAAPSPEAKQMEVSAALWELQALADECRVNTTAMVSADLLEGPPAEMLEGYAQRNDIDLIVISSHGRGGMSRLTLGSVTDSLIRHTHIPVVVIKPGPSYLHLRKPVPFRRVIVPLDGSTLAEQILPRAAILARADGSDMTLLHVLMPHDESDDGGTDPAIPSYPDIEVARGYLVRVAERLRKQGLSVKTDIVVGKDVSESIGEYATREQADLVAIATHGRGGVARLIRGSVADAVTRSSRTSMLVFRPQQHVAGELSRHRTTPAGAMTATV